MSEERKATNRADPTFKDVTIRLAQSLGIKVIGAEIPQTTTADMAFQMPTTARLAETLFSFLTGFEYAIIDFKGQGDNLDTPKFQANAGRTAWFCQRHPETPVHEVLNLIVSARYPQEFISEMREAAGRKAAIGLPATEDLIQQKDRPWLWRSSSYAQEVAIVVCRDLPLEPRYYEWLLFAPADSDAWKAVVRTLLREGRRDLLEIIRSMRPKEFKAMSVDYVNQLDSQELQRLGEDWLEVFEETVSEFTETLPDEVDQTLYRVFQSLPADRRERLLQKFIRQNDPTLPETEAENRDGEATDKQSIDDKESTV